MSQYYRLPNKEVTQNINEYAQAWKELGDVNRYMELTKPPKPIYEQLVYGCWKVDGSNASGNLIHVPVRVSNHPADFLLSIQKLYRNYIEPAIVFID